MNVKNGCKDLERYPHISRRVRDTLARLLYALPAALSHPVNFVLVRQWVGGNSGESPKTSDKYTC